MSTFELKGSLPLSDQLELERINAKNAVLRTADEAAFLAAKLRYVDNAVLRYHPNGNILEAEGNTLPTGYAGFQKGAIFYDLDLPGLNIYVNVGTSTSASWAMVATDNAISASPSLSPSVSPSRSASASVSPSSSASASPSVSPSASASLSPSVSVSASPSLSASPSSSVSRSPSLSASPSSSASASVSLSPSASASPSSSVSKSPSASPSFPDVS